MYHYQTTQENISMHISNIYADGELDKEGTYKKFLLVRQEGKRQVRRNIDHYKVPRKFGNSRRSMHLCTATLNMIERLSAELIQQKQGLRENYSTSVRDKD